MKFSIPLVSIDEHFPYATGYNDHAVIVETGSSIFLSILNNQALTPLAPFTNMV